MLKITGLDRLQQQLEDAQKAFRARNDGNLTAKLYGIRNFSV
jgi:hypothetical protein